MIHVIRVTTAGAAGSATGSAVSETNIRGFIEAIKIDYNAGAPATTDVTITELAALERTLLTISNSATDAVYYPSVATNDATGSARADYVRMYLDQSSVRIAVAGSDALTNAVVVYVQTSDY